jgi:hypothetical protein
VPTICEIERTPMKCHPRRGPEKTIWPKAHPNRSEVRSSKQPPNHKHPQSLVQQRHTPEDQESHRNNRQPRRRPPPHEHLHAKHSATNATSRDRNSLKMCKIQKRRSRQSLKMSWHTFVKRMSPYDSCRNSWLEERQWRKELRPCSNKSNKKEQLRQSCREQ